MIRAVRTFRGVAVGTIQKLAPDPARRYARSVLTRDIAAGAARMRLPRSASLPRLQPGAAIDSFHDRGDLSGSSLVERLRPQPVRQH